MNRLAPMSLPAQIAALLKQRTGLDAEALGPGAIARAVQQRLDAINETDHQAYWLRLHGETEEFQALIEAVVVPETWFFRHREALHALSRFAVQRLRGIDRPLRLLSLPCSTGEEPYSIVMALLDSGVPAHRFQVEAVDISALALEHARGGRYRDHAFRSGPLDFRDRYFRRAAGSYQLDERVRARVRLRRGNLLEPGLLDGEAPFDFVFCRNLLIYFDPATQRQAVAALARLTHPDGMVFVGPAEASLMTARGFHSAKVPLAFAFHPPGHAAAQAPAVASRPAPMPVPPRPPARQAAPLARRIQPAPRAADTSASPPVHPPSGSATDAGSAQALARIAAMADGGALEAATRACEDWLRAHGDNADAHCLHGILQDAGRLPALARESYRKALYLDPTHEEALHHMAALLESEGDAQGALRLRQRAERHARDRRHA